METLSENIMIVEGENGKCEFVDMNGKPILSFGTFSNLENAKKTYENYKRSIWKSNFKLVGVASRKLEAKKTK